MNALLRYRFNSVHSTITYVRTYAVNTCGHTRKPESERFRAAQWPLEESVRTRDQNETVVLSCSVAVNCTVILKLTAYVIGIEDRTVEKNATPL